MSALPTDMTETRDGERFVRRIPCRVAAGDSPGSRGP
jgi:hypothetical protein